ncbi:GtrA family protein [Cellulomonas sp. P22]|uniref:GtrA family protein n=1 Tax=Cellulomonas sp. P22 TaxID=3373189 RepID=UPI00378A6822
MTASAAGPRRLGFTRARLLEISRFLSVGAVSFVVDLGLFNLLRFGPGDLLRDKPITAKVISVAAATLVSWLGNRYWTFSAHKTTRRGRELLLYAVINVVGVLIGIGTLAFSHYVLDLRTPLEDNVSTILGIVLGTIVRYIGYKKLVFTAREDAAAPPPPPVQLPADPEGDFDPA